MKVSGWKVLRTGMVGALAATLALGAVPAAGAGDDAARAVGARPVNADRYRALKAAAASAHASARTTASAEAYGGASPTVVASFEGEQDDRFTPPDTTGALGPTRYVELVNSKIGIYRRNGARLSSTTFNDFMGKDTFLFDPQVIWDPDSRRFYFLMDDVAGNFDVDNRLAWGFSKTASPSGPGDWCTYSFGFGYGAGAFPDYPKLGASADFLLFGSNVFSIPDFAYLGADVAWVSKPADGATACPAASSYRRGVERDIRDPLVGDPTLDQLFTPVPASQADPSGTGWVVSYPGAIYGPEGPSEGEGEGERGEAATQALPIGSANLLYVLKVTKAANGDAVIGTPKRVRVPVYSFPPPAPQKDTPFTLDTLDARPTQAVAAKDPSKSGKTALWTQHTVAGGAGSEVRWYELDPAARSILRRGTVSDPSLWVFNGAISPDRAVDGARREYGANMVVGFSTSSPDAYPAIQMVSKRAGQPQSPFVLIRQSEGPNVDFSCEADVPCRWGDYSGATPDPASPSGRATGQVGLSNQWNIPGPLASLDPVWRTQIWIARP